LLSDREKIVVQFIGKSDEDRHQRWFCLR
jgi:hypothetical protein